jgi:hypothetical protein
MRRENWRGFGAALSIALAALLGACGEGRETPADAVAANAAPIAPVAPDAKLHWKVLAAAGDDSIPVFDNAVDRFSEILQSRGVGPVARFTSNPEILDSNRQIATVDRMTTTLAAMPAGPGMACLVFLTSHGGPQGLLMREDLNSERNLSPSMLGNMLDEGCGTQPTVAIVSGCYSGVFIGRVTEAPNRIIITAAREDRTSFGCGHEEQFTYFDGCLFEAWPRSPNWQALYKAVVKCVRDKEDRLRFTNSEPQAFFGDAVKDLGMP